MPYPSGSYINQIVDPAVRNELQQFYSLQQGWESVQHKDDGTHGTVTADSVTTPVLAVTGNATITGTDSVNGNVTASANSDPVTIGNLGAGIGHGLEAQNGTGSTASHWQVVAINAANGRTLRFIDVLDPSRAFAFEIQQRTSGGIGLENYYLLPGSNVGLSLGQNGAGVKLDEANFSTYNGGETGTWTPDLQFGGAKVGITYSTQTGTYSKFGNVVTAEMRIVLTSKGTSVGAASIAGLPYAPNLNPSALLDFGGGGVSLASTPYAALSGTSLFPLHISAGVRTQLTDANFSGTDDLRFGISYRV